MRDAMKRHLELIVIALSSCSLVACFRLVARENVKSEGGWEKRGRLFKSQAHPYRIRRYLEKVMEKVCVITFKVSCAALVFC